MARVTVGPKSGGGWQITETISSTGHRARPCKPRADS